MPVTKSILSATSDEDIRQQIRDALQGNQAYRLEWVADSGDLLLKILDTDLDLAIIDEDLHGMASSKLIAIIKKSRPRIPLIFIAASGSRQEVASTLEQGVFYFVIKPINTDELSEAVACALKKNP